MGSIDILGPVVLHFSSGFEEFWPLFHIIFISMPSHSVIFFLLCNLLLISFSKMFISDDVFSASGALFGSLLYIQFLYFFCLYFP